MFSEKNFHILTKLPVPLLEELQSIYPNSDWKNGLATLSLKCINKSVQKQNPLLPFIL